MTNPLEHLDAQELQQQGYLDPGVQTKCALLALNAKGDWVELSYNFQGEELSYPIRLLREGASPRFVCLGCERGVKLLYSGGKYWLCESCALLSREQARLRAEQEAREKARRQAEQEAREQARLRAEQEAKERSRRQAEQEAREQARLRAEQKAKERRRELIERRRRVRKHKREAEQEAKEQAHRVPRSASELSASELYALLAAFRVLGVQQGCSYPLVLDAYRSLARKWHPDRHPQNTKAATERMQEINKAFELLKQHFSAPSRLRAGSNRNR